MKKLFVIFCLFAPIFANAKLGGQSLADSLLKVLPGAKEDTGKAKILRKIAALYEYTNAGEGVKYINQSLTLAEELKWEKGIADACDLLGSYNFDRSDFPKSLEYYLKSLKINEQRGDKDRICRNVGNIGTVYLAQSNYPKAQEYFSKALKMSEEMGDKDGIAANTANIGQIYYNMGQCDSAIAYDIKSLNSYEDQGNNAGVIALETNIGAIYHHLHDYTKALEYFFKALALNEKLGNKRYIAGALGNIGNTYLYMAEDTGNVSKADNRVISSNAIYLQKAIEYLEKSIIACKEIGLNDALIDFDKDISNAYALDKKYKEALAYYKDYTTLNDSIFSTGNKIKIANLSTQRETDLMNKQVEITRLEETKARNERIFYITGIGLLLLFMIIVIRNYGKQKTANNLLEAEKVKSDDLASSLQDMLRQKNVLMKEIHHRVKNNLQVISTLLDLQLIDIKDERAKDAITESTARVRSISLIHQQLYQNENVSTVEFARYAKDLMQQITSIFKRPDQNIYLKNEIKETWLDIDTAIPLGLILNELLTNSYKYAFPDLKEGFVDIKLECTGNHYQLIYTDGGLTLPADFNPDGSKTLGMRVMKSLSRQLGGEFIYNKESRNFLITFKDTIARKSTD